MSKIFPATEETIEKAAKALQTRGLIVIPTETVYGIAGAAGDDKAIAKIFAAKNRPEFNPLIIHIASVEQARKIAVFDDRAEKLAAAFWPGPLTLVLPRKKDGSISLLATAGLDTIALRLPRHETARKLIQKAGPLAAPSANPSGFLSPTRASDIRPEIQSAAEMVIDGGAADVGLESTVVDLTAPTAHVLRLGGFDPAKLQDILGIVEISDGAGEKPKSPGQLLKHYAPKTPLRLGADNPRAGEALLAFGKNVPSGFSIVLNLSPSGNLEEAAGNLFRYLHDLDRKGVSSIAAMQVPESGLGLAINDRLRRAAASFS